MGRDDDVVAPTQRMSFGYGLGIEGVQRAAGDRVAVERAHQRLGIDDGAARAIDEERARLHGVQGLLVDQLARLRQQRRVQRDEIRLGQQIFELTFFDRNAIVSLLDEGIEEENAHAERGGSLRYPPGDVAETDQAERAAGKAKDRLAGRHLPPSRSHQPIVECDLAGAGQQQRQCVLSHLLEAVRRIVGDNDAGRGGRGEIDRVHADAVARDDLAIRHSRHHLGRDRARIGIEQCVAIGNVRQELLRGFRLQGYELSDSRECRGFHTQRIPHIVGDHDLRFVSHPDSSRLPANSRFSAMFRPSLRNGTVPSACPGPRKAPN